MKIVNFRPQVQQDDRFSRKSGDDGSLDALFESGPRSVAMPDKSWGAPNPSGELQFLQMLFNFLMNMLFGRSDTDSSDQPMDKPNKGTPEHPGPPGSGRGHGPRRTPSGPPKKKPPRTDQSPPSTGNPPRKKPKKTLPKKRQPHAGSSGPKPPTARPGPATPSTSGPFTIDSPGKFFKPHFKVDMSVANTPYNGSISNTKQLITEHARRLGIPPEWALAWATKESSLKNDFVGDGGRSVGCFQVGSNNIRGMRQRGQLPANGEHEALRRNPAMCLEMAWSQITYWTNSQGGNVTKALSGYRTGNPDSPTGIRYQNNIAALANFYRQHPDYMTNDQLPYSAGFKLPYPHE